MPALMTPPSSSASEHQMGTVGHGVPQRGAGAGSRPSPHHADYTGLSEVLHAMATTTISQLSSSSGPPPPPRKRTSRKPAASSHVTHSGGVGRRTKYDT